MKKTCYFLMLAACTAVLSLGSVASAEIIIADAAADYIDENTLPRRLGIPVRERIGRCRTRIAVAMTGGAILGCW